MAGKRLAYFGTVAVVLHRLGIVPRIRQHQSATIHDGDAGAQFGVGGLRPSREFRRVDP